MKSIYAYMNALESTTLCISDTTDSKLLRVFVWGLEEDLKKSLGILKLSLRW